MPTPSESDLTEQLVQTDDGGCPYCGGRHFTSNQHVHSTDHHVYNECSGCFEWSKSSHDVTIHGGV